MEANIEKMQEIFTKDLEELKNKQTEMNNTLKGISIRITEAEEQISDLEDQKKIEEEKEKKKENDMVFKAWLQKKREQVLEMRRIQRAKQIEDMNSRVSSPSS